jgi:hypothetical protein
MLAYFAGIFYFSSMLIALDYFFLIFHSLLMFVNLFGWIPKATRKLHLYTLLLTLLSWFVMGYFYGWGYCLLTDWHWDVLQALGERPLQSAYVEYLFERIFNLTVSKEFSDIITIAGLIFGISGALYVNLILPKWIKKK